eukprot:TRINITY_DN9181_c0_g1_i1.p1 TRINITY_DN9181_c0_g1~~TRINITY_DN9181_c0_g1_i1.p1  ORF type:complete len:727 (+),score=309.08 TRINITY_DN9181_c0_g1_i1:91-2271(+)
MEVDSAGFFSALAGPGRRVSLDPRKHAAAAAADSDGGGSDGADDAGSASDWSEAAAAEADDDGLEYMVEEGEEDEEDEDMEEDEEQEEEPAALAAAAAAAPKSQAAGAAKVNSVTIAEGQKQTATSWLDLPLSKPLQRAVGSAGWLTPTPVQCKAIPAALEGWDVCARAVTGSGKTAAFVLPILERCLSRERGRARIRCVVVLPTRELAVQCLNMVEELSKGTSITKSLVVGGLPMQPQQRELRMCPDVVVATPGRLVDHLRNSQGVGIDSIEMLVLDEADRLLDEGFKDELKELLRHCPKKRQTMLFSATMTEGVNQLAELALTKPLNVDVGHVAVSPNLTQEFVRIPREHPDKHKDAYVSELCAKEFTRGVMVFCERKTRAQHVRVVLELSGVNAVELHQNMSQEDRLLALDRFRTREAGVLVTTELSARGLDIPGVKTVINYDIPADITAYVHRVGRTARIGNQGRAVSFVRPQDLDLMRNVMRLCKATAAGAGAAKLKRRDIDQGRLDGALQRLQALRPKITERVQQGRMERELALATRKVDKAENTVRFSDEIHARPRSTWFSSEKEKKQARKRAREEREAQTQEDLSEWVTGSTATVHLAKRTRPNAPGTKQERIARQLEQKRKEEAGTSKAARDAKKWGKTYQPPTVQKLRGKSVKKGNRAEWLKKRREAKTEKLAKAQEQKRKNGPQRGKLGKDKKKEWKFTERKGGRFKSKKRYKRR